VRSVDVGGLNHADEDGGWAGCKWELVDVDMELSAHCNQQLDEPACEVLRMKSQPCDRRSRCRRETVDDNVQYSRLVLGSQR
jgi:hypothetical protein